MTGADSALGIAFMSCRCQSRPIIFMGGAIRLSDCWYLVLADCTALLCQQLDGGSNFQAPGTSSRGRLH